MREIMHFEIFMDWCAILFILSLYLTDIIDIVSKLRLNHISFYLFDSIAQTLNGFISKHKFGKITPTPKDFKNLSFL